MKLNPNSPERTRNNPNLRRLLSAMLAAVTLLCLLPLLSVFADGPTYTVVDSNDSLFADEGELTVRFEILDEYGNRIPTFCGDYGKAPPPKGTVYGSIGSPPHTAALAFALSHEAIGGVSDAEFNRMFGTSLEGTARLNMMHSVVWYFMGSAHPLSGPNFITIVRGIEEMVSAYNSRSILEGYLISELNPNYIAANGALTFSYSGYKPKNPVTVLTWSGDTAGLSVTVMGRGVASGETITENDTVIIEYTGTGEVEFTLTDNGLYLLNESIRGEVFQPLFIEHMDTADMSDYQRIVTGEAAFGQLTRSFTVRNDPKGDLTVVKSLAESNSDWGADENTVFRAKVKDDVSGNYLTLNGTAPNYTYTGMNATGSEITFSAKQAAVIAGIPAGTVCVVEEIIAGDAHYTASYSGNGVIVANNVNNTVTVTNIYEAPGPAVGSLIINKKLAGSSNDWGVDESTVYQIRVKDVTNNNYLRFTGTGPVYTCTGNSGSSNPNTGDIIKVTAGQPITVSNLWADAVYEVEEISGEHYAITYQGNNVMVAEGQNSTVTVVNTYDPPGPAVGNLIINKKIAGSFNDWGADESTVYSVRVKDTTNNNYLRFTGTGPVYTCVGNSGSGDPNTGDIIKLTAGQPITVTNLWVSAKYEVEEISGAHYAISYQGNNVMVAEGQNSTVTVVNTYEHGTGDLVINKKLAGSFNDWGVDESTVYQIRIKDVTDDNYLRFTGTGPVYTCTGNSGSSNPNTGDIIKVTAGQPITVTNLWANAVYEVEEIGGEHYAITYQGNNVMVAEGQNSTVTVVNTYERGTGDLVINKKLAGSSNDWGVDESTVFQIRVKDATNDNYLRFSGTGPVYTCIGNSGSGDPNTGDLIQVTAGQPAAIKELWANVRYEVEEIGGAHYAITYQGNNVMFTEGENSTVTVINTYEHGTGDLIISKRIDGSYDDWGVDESTVFDVKIRDTTRNNYLLFKSEPEPDGKYWCVGNNEDGLSEPYTGDTITELPFNAAQPLIITNLWIGAVYVAEEIDSPFCVTSYIGNGAIYTDGQNSSITIVNTYEHGTGAIIINKKLAGSYDGWGVDSFTPFTVKVWDATDGNYLLFRTEPEADGSYWCVGNSVDGLSEPYAGAAVTELTVTAGRPLVGVNLWNNHAYRIDETAGNGYAMSYINNSAVFRDGENSIVTVVNDYEPPIVPPVTPGVPPFNPPTTPGEPPVTPGEPPVTPGEPPVTPGEPPVTPGEPPVTPGEPPVTPGEPPVTPGEPPVTPGEPPVTPGEPPVTPGEPPVTPGEPPVTPNEPQVPAGDPPVPAAPPPETPGEPPVIPGEPPATPNEPEPPVTPGEPPVTPQTGDNRNPAIPFVLLISGAGCVALTIWLQRRKTKIMYS